MLRILPDLIDRGFDVIRCIGLFPTIERMMDSPNGQRLFPWIERFCTWDAILRIIFSWLVYLPTFLKKLICVQFMVSGVERCPPCVLQAAVELVDINVIRNIIFMAANELLSVSDLDHTLLAHKDRCRFLYGTTDKWCPLSYGFEMQKKLGKDSVVIDDKNCEHAFVIKDGSSVAERVGRWTIEVADFIETLYHCQT